MKTMVLSILGARGDEVDVITVPGVRFADAREADKAAQIRSMREQMAEVHAKVRQTLADAGIVTSLDALDLRMTTTRALVEQFEEERIVVPVPLRSGGPETRKPGSAPLTGPASGILIRPGTGIPILTDEDDWNHLFDLDDSDAIYGGDQP
jgi:hypothetical protein